MIDVSPRIQRITIRAWQYDFEPQHIPGRNNVISDALSRVGHGHSSHEFPTIFLNRREGEI